MTDTMTTAPELVLINGRIHTMGEERGDSGLVSGLAIGRGMVMAAGGSSDMAALAGPSTRVIDLGGRCVVPGLLDNHIHFVRAGLTWNRELRWERCTDLTDGLAMIAHSAATRPRGEWTLVIGGWHEQQFVQGRAPTPAELDAAAASAPVYVQMMYDWALVNAAGMAAIGLTPHRAREAGEHLFEWDGNDLTGRALGMEGCKWLYAQLPKETFEEQVDSTARLSRDLNRFGVTGVVDGGGVNTSPDVYDAVYETDRRGELTVRTYLTVHGSARGVEPEEMRGYLRFGRPRHGSDMLRLLGAGEVLLYSLHDRVHTAVDVTAELQAQYEELLMSLAERQWTVQMHAHRPETVSAFLDACERVNRVHPIRDLRWGIVHGEMLREDQLPQLTALNLSMITQSLLRFLGEQLIGAFGEELVKDAPPMRAIIEAGIPVSGGTDAMRGASFDPFTSLHFYLTGRTIGGKPIVAEKNLLTREEALRLYTRGTAYDCFMENSLGSLQPGFTADLAVLSADYFASDVDDLLTIESELTLVGGRPVHIGEAFRGIVEERELV